MINIGKNCALSRNFVFFNDLSSYYNTLEIKLSKNKQSYDKESLKKLFNILGEIQSNDEQSFNNLVEILSSYTEGFVIDYSNILSRIISMDEETLSDLMFEYDFDNKYQALNIVTYIIEEYTTLVTNECNKIIDDTDLLELSNEALKLREEETLVNNISYEILDSFPIISKYKVLGDLLMKLNINCNDLAYNYITSVRGELMQKKENVYNMYHSHSSQTRVARLHKGQRANLPMNKNKKY